MVTANGLDQEARNTRPCPTEHAPHTTEEAHIKAEEQRKADEQFK